MNSKFLALGAFVAASLVGYVGAQQAIPGVIMGVATKKMAERGGFNAMAHGNLATPENQPIVRPSPDLAYSTCPFDLTGGPVRINVVPVAGRYSSLSIFDGQTDVAFVRNDVLAGGKPYSIVIAREGQSVPAGAEVVRVGQDRGIALIRLLLVTPSEIGQLEAVRRQSGCEPLQRTS